MCTTTFCSFESSWDLKLVTSNRIVTFFLENKNNSSIEGCYLLKLEIEFTMMIARKLKQALLHKFLSLQRRISHTILNLHLNIKLSSILETFAIGVPPFPSNGEVDVTPLLVCI